MFAAPNAGAAWEVGPRLPRKPPKMFPRKPNCGAAAAGPRAATTAERTARLLDTGIMDRGLWLLQLGLEKEDNVDVGISALNTNCCYLRVIKTYCDL